MSNRLLSIAAWFLAGGAVTAIFSGSLAKLATSTSLTEVLVVGMIVPSFTWVVQLTASALLMPAEKRMLYWDDLGHVCWWGSVALLPAAALNLALSQPPQWPSVANVLTSVAIMAADLFRRSARYGISPWWPVSWCLTITFNMGLFLWTSRHWWQMG